MTPDELKNKLKEKLGIDKMHPLHEAMIDECCEHVLENKELSDDTYILSVKIGFVTAITTLRALLQANLNNADKVILNYRGQTFSINSNSPLILPV